MKQFKVFSILTVGMAFCGTGCASNAGSENNSSIRVEIEQVKLTDVSQTFAYSGTIEEAMTIPLNFSSVGTVSHVLVSEGDFVKKGQLLAILDNESYQNAYLMAHATELQAEDAYRRLKPMHNNGNLPDVKYVEMETGLQQARAAASIAKKYLNDCNLYATTDGFVGKRSIDVGMSVIPGFASITIVKINKVFARVAVAEDEITMIRKGQKAIIKISALGSTKYNGMVEEIGILADPITHTYKIKVGIDNSELAIKPGMICNTTIEVPNKSTGVVVPNGALMVDEMGKTFVFVVNSNHTKAIRKYIQTGSLLNNGVEATAGVAAGEYVVTAGQHKLVNNASVDVFTK